MVVSMASVGINFVVALTLTRAFHLGHRGLALSTSAVAIFNFLVLLWLIRGRIGGINGAMLLRTFAKIVIASLVLTAICASSHFWLHAAAGTKTVGLLLDLGISIGLGAAGFYAVCLLLKVEELETAEAALLRPVLRRFGFR